MIFQPLRECLFVHDDLRKVDEYHTVFLSAFIDANNVKAKWTLNDFAHLTLGKRKCDIRNVRHKLILVKPAKRAALRRRDAFRVTLCNIIKCASIHHLFVCAIYFLTHFLRRVVFHLKFFFKLFSIEARLHNARNKVIGRPPIETLEIVFHDFTFPKLVNHARHPLLRCCFSDANATGTSHLLNDSVLNHLIQYRTLANEKTLFSFLRRKIDTNANRRKVLVFIESFLSVTVFKKTFYAECRRRSNKNGRKRNRPLNTCNGAIVYIERIDGNDHKECAEYKDGSTHIEKGDIFFDEFFEGWNISH